MSATIIWVNDDFDGPENGLIDYNGEKLWFSRIIEKGKSERRYTLSRVEPETIVLLYENHKKKSEITGFPLNHGDPMRVKKQQTTIKRDVAQDIPKGSDSLDAKLRALSSSTGYSHTIIGRNIKGIVVTTIHESDIINYSVPRRVEFF